MKGSRVHKVAHLGARSMLVFMPLLAWAAPDAGSVLQQLEARPSGVLVAPTLKTPQTPTPPASQQGGPVVRVNAFRIEGPTLVKPELLQKALSGFTGRDLSLTQLQEAAWVLVQTYREAGWLANAWVPQQEIEGGVVTLRVIEARLGRVRIDFPEGKFPRKRIRAMADDHLKEGDLLNLQQLDRLLLLMGDMPGVMATASFAQGRKEGNTDVLVAVKRSKAREATVSVDNFGGVSTGTQRVSAVAALNNAAGWGEALQLQGIATEGSQYARVVYSMPVGSQGWRAGVHANHMQYKLLGAFAELNATGSAQSWGADLLVPLIRQPQRNLSLQVTTDHKNFENLALANAQAASTSTVSNYTLDVVRAGISGNWRDPLSATAQNTANVQVSWGQLDLSRSPNATADAAAANTAGAFRKWSVNFNREQALTVQSTWYIQTAAQWANRNLDSSEKLYLGGASGVRAYPSNEAGGTLGGTVTTGIRHRLTDTLTLNGFTDWGRIRVYQRNTNAAGNDITSLNTQSLQGTGLTLLWRGQQGQELSATWSRRIGSNPAAQPSTGADSDGTLKLNRLWLSAMLNF